LVLQQSDINNLISDEANLFFSICKSPRGGSTDAVYKLTKDSRQVFALATEQNCPDKLAQDALNLYWASNRQLFQISKQGGSAPTVVNAESPVTGLALYQSEIYFSACDSSGAGALFQWMKTAAPKIIARDARCMQIAASDGANIFFIANDRVNGDELWRIAKNGGAVEKIASLARYPVVVGKILADATTIYWTTRQDPSKPQGDADDYNSVLALNTETRALRVIANQQPRPSALALDATNIFWSNCGTARFNFENIALLRAPLRGGAANNLATVCANSLAVDAALIYWAAKDGIWKVNK
ncbi:MAG: hypothetical protein HY070_12135, partial [Chloroflexi bacterium]|nr:hypothetical protein [Chloroflexota bacterium]